MNKIGLGVCISMLALSAHALVTTTVKTKAVSGGADRVCILKPGKKCENQVFDANDGFPREQIENINFDGSQFNGISSHEFDLRGIYAPMSSFKNTKLSYVVLGGSELHEANFAGADIENSYFDEVVGDRINFEGATLKSVSLEHASLDQGNFKKANLNGVMMRQGTTLQHANFEGAQINGLWAPSVRGEKSNFAHTEITNSDFSGAYLSGSSFQCAEIGDNVKFDRAMLKEAQFVGARFNGEFNQVFGASFDRSSGEAFCFSSWMENGTPKYNGCKNARRPDCCASLDEASCGTAVFGCRWTGIPGSSMAVSPVGGPLSPHCQAICDGLKNQVSCQADTKCAWDATNQICYFK